MRGGVETVGGDDSETGLVTIKKGKTKIDGIGASLTPNYRDKEESNSNSTPHISSCTCRCPSCMVPTLYVAHPAWCPPCMVHTCTTGNINM